MADLHAVAVQAARKAGIDPNIFVRQIAQESGFNPNARSGAGAVGIAQIVPRYHPGVNPLDPVASLNYAANWMGQLVRKYGGSYQKALSVYNSGQPDKYQDPSFAGGQTYNYVRSILGGGAGGPTAAVGPVAAPPAATPTLPSLSAPRGAPAAPLPRGLPSPLLAAVNTGNEMFGLPQLPAQLMTPVAPVAAPTLSTAAPPAARVLPAPSVGAGRGAVSGHVAPVVGNYKFGRIDQGVDVSQNAPYVSPGSGTVVRIGKVAGGTNLGVYVKLDRPVTVNGRTYPGVYVWHTSPLVKPGQRVSAGQPIMSAGSAEVGFATANGMPVAPLVGGLGAGTQPTSPGQDMLAFFKAAHG